MPDVDGGFDPFLLLWKKPIPIGLNCIVLFAHTELRT